MRQLVLQAQLPLWSRSKFYAHRRPSNALARKCGWGLGVCFDWPYHIIISRIVFSVNL